MAEVVSKCALPYEATCTACKVAPAAWLAIVRCWEQHPLTGQRPYRDRNETLCAPCLRDAPDWPGTNEPIKSTSPYLNRMRALPQARANCAHEAPEHNARMLADLEKLGKTNLVSAVYSVEDRPEAAWHQATCPGCAMKALIRATITCHYVAAGREGCAVWSVCGGCAGAVRDGALVPMRV